MLLTDYPSFVPLHDYTRAIDSMLDKLKQLPGIVSVYQIGGVSNPGISDIDLLVLFEDDARCALNPLDGLSTTERYLYVHNLFGTSVGIFRGYLKYDFFHNYRLLYGREFEFDSAKLPQAQREAVNAQSALEYLVKMYINMTIERIYGIVRARGVLLLAKAVKYDLDALGRSDGAPAEMIRQIMDWRKHWFDAAPTGDSIVRWHGRFYEELREILRKGIAAHGFFIPSWADRRIAANVRLRDAPDVGYRRRGFALPSAFGRLGRKYFNMQHRLNRFVFELPITSDSIPAPLLERHGFITDACEYNWRHLRCFIPVPYGISIFRRH